MVEYYLALYHALGPIPCTWPYRLYMPPINNMVEYYSALYYVKSQTYLIIIIFISHLNKFNYHVKSWIYLIIKYLTSE